MDTLTVAGKLESLSEIAEYIKAIAQKANLDKKQMYKLRLAVDEIATNIISYNPDFADDEFMRIMSHIDNGKLFVCIEDKGIYFDPYEKINIERENIDKPMEEKPIGNLGIYLAVDGVDEFIYERKNHKNYNTFIVNIESQ